MKRWIVLLLLLMLLSRPLAAQSDAPFLVEAAFDVVWAYPGQAVVYTVTAYSDTAREVAFDMPAFEGFWQAEARAFTGGSATVDGKQYSTSTYQVSLYPQHVGIVEVPPARVTFAETVFSAGAIRTSNAAALDVQELPPAPVNFSGLVGAVGARFDAEPTVVRIGEPVEVILRLQGAANLAQLIAPEPNLPDGWRIYAEPRENQTDFDGSVLTQLRVLHWRAIPDRAGRAALSLPPLTVFTLANGYETVDIAPIDFEVLPGINGELSRESITASVTSLIQPVAPQTSTSDVPVAAWLLAPLAAGAVIGSRKGLQRWRVFRAAARKRNALQLATSRLRSASRVEGNLAAIEKAVTGYFADYGLDMAGRDEAVSLLVEVESERYNPEGTRQSAALAKRAAELLRRIESGQ